MLDEMLGVNFEPGALVKIKRSSGEIEDGWRISLKDVSPLIEVTKREGEKLLSKRVLYKDLVEWNVSTNEASENK